MESIGPHDDEPYISRAVSEMTAARSLGLNAGQIMVSDDGTIEPCESAVREYRDAA